MSLAVGIVRKLTGSFSVDLHIPLQKAREGTAVADKGDEVIDLLGYFIKHF